jgi:hypothetical protein
MIDSVEQPIKPVAMLYKTLSAAVYGIDGNIIEVGVDVSGIKQRDNRFHTGDCRMPLCARAETGSAQP